MQGFEGRTAVRFLRFSGAVSVPFAGLRLNGPSRLCDAGLQDGDLLSATIREPGPVMESYRKAGWVEIHNWASVSPAAVLGGCPWIPCRQGLLLPLLEIQQAW